MIKKVVDYILSEGLIHTIQFVKFEVSISLLMSKVTYSHKMI